MIDINTELVTDPIVRENFIKISQLINNNPFLSSDWQVLEAEFLKAETNAKFRHNLPFVPKDTLVIFIEGNYNFYFLNAKFDREYLYANVGGPCRIRFIIGRTKQA